MAQTKYKHIVISTGAGISAESGLKTFRDNNGLWENHRVEDVATPEAFKRNPDLVHKFYNMRRLQLKEAKPNAAHLALAGFEKTFEGEFLLVTQNVDDLHDRAGSKNLLHMHGELTRIFCVHCGDKKTWLDELSVKSVCLACQKPGGLRPDIVWFGEMPYHMDEIYEHLEACDLFVSIGTSGNVYPAAGFAAAASGAFKVEINLEPSLVANHFDEHRVGPATETVPAFIKSLM